MTLANPTVCQECGRDRHEGESLCSLCGHLFARSAETERAPAPPPAAPAPAPPPLAYAAPVSVEPRILGLTEPWFFLTLGALTAPLFAVTPILQYMGWFLSSLTHEMGHCAVAWLFGMPAFPAIRLDGHAAAFHQDQKLMLVVVVVVCLTMVGSKIRSPETHRATIVVLVVLYLALALTPARELLFLLGGHAGELVFAILCLGRALTGGFTSSAVERGLYGTLGWYLLGSNAILTTGLAFSGAAQRAYARSGSFGLTNDYLRLAEDYLGLPLAAVALPMTLVALGCVPLALLLARIRRLAGNEPA